jgi:hypothetical protein
VKKRTFILCSFLFFIPTWGNAHPPIPLDKWSAQASVDNLEISIAHQREDINRLLLLKGDIAEQILRAAQEAWISGAYTKSVKKLLAVTMVPGFEDHASRAAIYQWLGISYASLGFASLARDALLAAYVEPQQTQITRMETTRHLLDLPGSLPANISLELWSKRRGVTTQDAELPSPYLFCRALFRSGLIKGAGNCFSTEMPDDYDSIRAIYFLGVVALIKKNYTLAREHFLEAEVIAKKQLKETAVTDMNVERRSPMIEIRSGVVDENIDTRWADIHIRTQLALGRLAAAQENWQQANLHYRYVLPGHPTFFEAARERAVVFDRLRQPRMAAASLVSIGQASGVTGPGLKQSMWRAELLGRGEAYDASQQAYTHIEHHTQQISSKLTSENDHHSRPEQMLRWLAPDLGLQFSDLLNEVNELSTAIRGIEHEVKQSLRDVKVSFKKDLRAEEISELNHRLQDIKLGLTDDAKSTALTQKLNRLEMGVKQLGLQSDQLRAHHRVFALQLLNKLSSSLSGHMSDLAMVQTNKADANKQIAAATLGLFNTLETQSGLGRLNIFVWKKEAVSRAIAEEIEQKRRIVDWIESEDPSVSPTQR